MFNDLSKSITSIRVTKIIEPHHMNIDSLLLSFNSIPIR
ncbi:hypothetical protein XNC1_2357 [Xenorhabdus nematophila ATCC 19061]|uniref:Uncharacterized protein n=1 Tax=Xenorhabdus nematophila (strain ATCC 19061 / DSM 3370 / CCUG 14189 / LMG 1036 / NCIMB 9965 / AN6) TaxID=406817 RepID=D3VGI0_XENNA|nr:hypothetical protein XNC1_2357 [Xenorhabdus nematophila ATCC 19061]